MQKVIPYVGVTYLFVMCIFMALGSLLFLIPLVFMETKHKCCCCIKEKSLNNQALIDK